MRRRGRIAKLEKIMLKGGPENFLGVSRGGRGCIQGGGGEEIYILLIRKKHKVSIVKNTPKNIKKIKKIVPT